MRSGQVANGAQTGYRQKFRAFSGKAYLTFIFSIPRKKSFSNIEIASFFSNLEDFKIYIYSHHEKTMMRKLFDKYGGDNEIYSKIVENMIDLLSLLPFIFPTTLGLSL